MIRRLVLFAAFAPGWLPSSAQIPPDAGLVSGSVLDADGTPAAHATVTLSTAGWKPKDAVAITDEQGRFGFLAVPAGQYYLYANVDGCGFASFGARSAGQPPAVLTLKPGEARRGVRLACSPLGSISGTVLDADGEPLPGTTVQSLSAGYERWKPKFSYAGAAGTNPQGEYRISNLPPGKYALMARTWTVPSQAGPQDGGAPLESYAPQLYRDADRVSAATLITISGQPEVNGIDFHLQARRTARIEGKVTLPPGFEGKGGILVSAYSTGLPEGLLHTNDTTAGPPEYRFSLQSLAPGSYLVSATADAGGRTYRGTASVDLGQELAEVNLALEPGIEIAGRVRVEGEAAPGARPSKVLLAAGDFLTGQAGAPQSELQPDGAFRLKNVLPGIWDIAVMPIPPGGYIKSMRYGGQDVLTEDMVIGRSSLGSLDIVVSTRGGVVEGTVTGQDGKPAKAVVLLAPEGRLRKVWSYYDAVSSDEDGRFEFRGVTPDTYRLFAFENMDAQAAQNPEFLASIRDRGVAFEIEEGSRVSREVPLMPLPPGGAR